MRYGFIATYLLLMKYGEGYEKLLKFNHIAYNEWLEKNPKEQHMINVY